MGGVNVRWDSAAQDAGFWSKPGSTARESASQAGDRIRVQALLFGALAPACSAGPIALELHRPFSARDVIEALARRLGDPFRERVLDASGRKHRHCRIFVDGLPADEIDAQVAAGPDARVEMILLTAAEGG